MAEMKQNKGLLKNSESGASISDLQTNKQESKTSSKPKSIILERKSDEK